MTAHELRCWPEYFQAVRSGHKTVELRRDDRPYVTGDALHLREYDPMQPGYTGESEYVRVTHVLRGGEWLAPGYCALSIRLMAADGRARVQEDFKLSFDAERAAHEDTRAALALCKAQLAQTYAHWREARGAELMLVRCDLEETRRVNRKLVEECHNLIGQLQQAQTELAELAHIVGTETPIAALDLATTWQAEKAHMQERIRDLEDAP